MEFQKEYEKFAFGIGSEKTAGSGKITDIVSPKKTESPEKSRQQLIAEVAAETITIITGIAVGIIKIRKNKKKKNK